MEKSSSIFIIFFVFSSCKYKENSWLNNYKEIKCNYSEVEKFRSTDSLNTIRNLGNKLSEIEIEIREIDKPITDEIAKLENSRSKIVTKYLDVSNKITEIQTAKYGHNSTPEFEDKLAKIEREGNSKTKVFEKKIDLLNQKLAQNNKYQELNLKKIRIKAEITEAYVFIKQKYSRQLKNLQRDLIYLNNEFKEISSNLNVQEIKTLTIIRDSIKQNPCTFTFKK